MGFSVAWVRAGGKLQLPIGSPADFLCITDYGKVNSCDTQKKGSPGHWPRPCFDPTAFAGDENSGGKLGQAAKGQAFPLRGNSPADRECSVRQIKAAKQPRRKLGHRHGAITKRTQFWESAAGPSCTGRVSPLSDAMHRTKGRCSVEPCTEWESRLNIGGTV